MKAKLQNFLPGLKHYGAAILAAVLPNFNELVANWVSLHPGLAGSFVAGLLVFLKQVTK